MLSSNFTRGWEFTTTKSIAVQSLGWWDSGGDGLNSSHQVAIFTSSGVQVMLATVAAGTSEVLKNGFRFDTEITGNIYLDPGTYIIAGLSTFDDPVAAALGSVNMASGITFSKNRASTTAGFSFPSATQAGRNFGVFGPDFTFIVPEPSTQLSAGIGMLLLLAGSGVRSRFRTRAVQPSNE